MWNWHQNVQNLIRSLIGNLIQVFWCISVQRVPVSESAKTLA